MSDPYDEFKAWLESVIPSDYIGMGERWVENHDEPNQRFWVLYSSGGQIEGSLQINPNYRLIIMGARQDNGIASMKTLASDIITRATCSDEEPDFTTDTLALIQPISWISPIRWTEESRPFIELNFTTIVK